MASRHLKTTIFFKSTASLSGQNFPDFDFWGAPNFLQISSSLFSPSFRCVLPVVWHRAAVPEAKHRYTWQPAKATIPWSSSSSRPIRPLMRRAVRAVASDDDWGETSWGMGLLWGCEWRCWPFKFVAHMFHSLWKDVPRFLYQHLVFVIALMFPAPRPFTDKAFPYWRFSLGRILERPMQSKIDHSFSALFNGPWYLDVYLPDSVTCVLLKILWSQCKGHCTILPYAAHFMNRLICRHFQALAMPANPNWGRFFEATPNWSTSHLVTKTSNFAAFALKDVDGFLNS